MTVYVDDMHLHPMGQLGRMKMCHMIADSTAELLAMADQIGLDRRWLQKPGTSQEHFDISMSKRRIAVERGAVEITMRQLAKMTIDKRGNLKSAGTSGEKPQVKG